MELKVGQEFIVSKAYTTCGYTIPVGVIFSVDRVQLDMTDDTDPNDSLCIALEQLCETQLDERSKCDDGFVWVGSAPTGLEGFVKFFKEHFDEHGDIIID